MTGREYDEEASERLHIDVVHEADDRPTPVTRWAMPCDASTRSTIRSPVVFLHYTATVAQEAACATRSMTNPSRRGQEGMGLRDDEAIADHFGVEYPGVPERRIDGERVAAGLAHEASSRHPSALPSESTMR